MMKLASLLYSLRRADRARAGLPGEHWATFGAGAAMLRWAARSRSPLMRVAALGGGAMLLYRAIGGRDGLVGRLRRMR